MSQDVFGKDFLFKSNARLYRWSHPPVRKWQFSANGEMRIVTYEKGKKSQLVFMPRVEDAITMHYVADAAEKFGGMRAHIHEALSVKRHVLCPWSIVFGKAASRSHINHKGQAIKTAWCVRFEERWMPNNFSFLLNRLVEVNGNASKLVDEHNSNDLFEDSSEVDEDADVWTDDDESSNGVADGDGSLDHLDAYQYPEEPAYYEVDDEEDEEEEDKFEEEDDFGLPLGTIDDETALRISRRRAIHHGASSDDDDEVAQSQPLY
jgi:hypothetical protein